jgi:hypothetical protein
MFKAGKSYLWYLHGHAAEKKGMRKKGKAEERIPPPLWVVNVRREPQTDGTLRCVGPTGKE